MYNDKKGRFFVAAEDIPAGKAFNFLLQINVTERSCICIGMLDFVEDCKFGC